MMDKVKQQLGAFKVPIIIVIILLAVFVGARYVLPLISGGNPEEETPVTGIEAECNTTFTTMDEISLEGFSVYAVHEDGSREAIPTEACELSTENSVPVGESVTVEIAWVGTEEDPVDEPMGCEVEAAMNRERVAGVQCGYPEVSDVTAVFYSNGELCFEGEGDVMTFDEGDMPWLSLDLGDASILSVSFEDGVAPVNMNYWFEGLESLAYCGEIPSSVKTMAETFSGCTSLSVAADWAGCDELLNISSCYYKCYSLTETSPIPENVTIARYTYEYCTSLQSTPDMTGAVSLTDAEGMFKDCEVLIEASVPPNAEDISLAFQNCTNLKDMPEIPDTVTNMEKAFANCLALTNLTEIPAGVENMKNAFAGCEMVEGELVVNTECENYSGMFSGAAIATTLDLTGPSRYLQVYANTCDSGNVTANGEAADPDQASYKDTAKKIEEGEAAGTAAETQETSEAAGGADNAAAESTG